VCERCELQNSFDFALKKKRKRKQWKQELHGRECEVGLSVNCSLLIFLFSLIFHCFVDFSFLQYLWYCAQSSKLPHVLAHLFFATFGHSWLSMLEK
jgi:hypothetical protein